MKKDMLTIIKKEFSRFFGDKRLVFSTILMPGLLIYLIYTFMGQGMMNAFQTDDAYVAKAYVENMPEDFTTVFASMSAEWITVSETETDEIKEKLKNKEADVLIVFPEAFTELVSAYDVTTGMAAPNVEIFYNSTESESEKMYSILTEMLDAYESALTNKFDVNAGEGEYDMASEKDVAGQIFSMLLPMLLMTFLFSGCISVAPESIAGEKERGTIATLLVTPMKRSALALGKIISLSCIALLSGASSFIGTMLSLPSLTGGEVSTAVYTVLDYVLLLGIILSTVLVLVALISIISALAKSIKEASTAVSPLMILVMVISLIPMFGGEGQKGLGAFFIPLYNSVQCMHGIFSFAYEPVQMIITMVINVVAAGILAWGLTRLFNSEKVMFSK